MVFAPQDGLDAGQQLAWLKGLGQIIVGAHLQANDAVHRVAFGREHQHRHLAHAAGQGADALAHLQAVHVGQHQVQDHQLNARCLQAFQATACIGRVGHGKTVLPQIVRHHARQAHIVFDHQELVHGLIIYPRLRLRVSER